MEILDLITRILYIIAIVAVIVVPLATMLLACRQVTGTWDLRHFYGDSRYWAMSILNFIYKEKTPRSRQQRELRPKNQQETQPKQCNELSQETKQNRPNNSLRR